MKFIFQISILLVFLLQGLFAIEGVSLCVHSDGSFQIEVSDNCCEEKPSFNRLNVDCEGCEDFPSCFELYSSHSKAEIKALFPTVINKFNHNAFQRDIKFKANSFPHDQFPIPISTQLVSLKKIILLI